MFSNGTKVVDKSIVNALTVDAPVNPSRSDMHSAKVRFIGGLQLNIMLVIFIAPE